MYCIFLHNAHTHSHTDGCIIPFTPPRKLDSEKLHTHTHTIVGCLHFLCTDLRQRKTQDRLSAGYAVAGLGGVRPSSSGMRCRSTVTLLIQLAGTEDLRDTASSTAMWLRSGTKKNHCQGVMSDQRCENACACVPMCVLMRVRACVVRTCVRVRARVRDECRMCAFFFKFHYLS